MNHHLRLCVAAVTAVLAIASPTVPRAQTPAAEADKDPVHLQTLRNQWVAERRKKVYYTGRKFDVESLPDYVPEQRVSGKIRIWGLNYLGDSMLKEYWEEGFRKYQPGITLEFNLPTALTSTTGLVAGTADIGANRRMTFTERLQYQRMFSRDPLEVPLATGSLDVGGWSDCMCIFVHKDNPIAKLTLKQLDGIFGAARLGGWDGTNWKREYARGSDENLRTWGQLGLTGEWQDKPIHPHGAVVRYDTATKFSDAVLHGSDQWNESTRMYANWIADDGSFVIWEQAIADDMAKDRYGIAYDGYGYKNASMKAVAIQFEDGGPFVEPTLETIQDRSYQLFQANYWYVNREPGKPLDPKIKEFLKYTLSRQGQEAVIRDGKYTPLNAAVVRQALKSLE